MFGITSQLESPETAGLVMLSYMDEWALAATCKNRATKEATSKDLKIYARLFVEAKSVEVKSWLTTVKAEGVGI